MVGDQDANVAILELPNNVLNVFNRDGIDPGKGFVEHDKLGIDGQTACDFGTTPLSTGKLVAEILAYLL